VGGGGPIDVGLRDLNGSLHRHLQQQWGMIRGAAAADGEGSRGVAEQCFGGIIGCAAILASRASEASKSCLVGNLDAARMQLIDPDVKGLGQSIEAGCGCEIARLLRTMEPLWKASVCSGILRRL
jgi:hypothetical protein